MLITGGSVWDNSEGAYTQTATAEIYNPATGTFTLTGSMAQGLRLCNRRYARGGAILNPYHAFLRGATQAASQSLGTFT